jgi:hypothetical protein
LKSGAGFAGTMTTSTLMASITAAAAVASEARHGGDGLLVGGGP